MKCLLFSSTLLITLLLLGALLPASAQPTANFSCTFDTTDTTGFDYLVQFTDLSTGKYASSCTASDGGIDLPKVYSGETSGTHKVILVN